jgi:hypothetical protein
MKDAGDLFDQYAAAYEQALSSAIAPSGESREYFAEGRVAWLKRCLDEIKEAPRAVLDFGCGGRGDHSLASPRIESGMGRRRGCIRHVPGNGTKAPRDGSSPV